MLELLFRELEHEILGKSLAVASHGLVERSRGHTIEYGQVEIEYDLLPAQEVNLRGDPFNRNQAPLAIWSFQPEVHRQAALAAELSGKSLNQWAEEVLGRAAR